jgi:hypothetical protein
MAFVLAGSPSDIGVATSKQIVVPPSINNSHVALVVFSGSSPLPTGISVTVDRPSATVAQVLAPAANSSGTPGGVNYGNEWIGIWKIYGVQGGDAITCSCSSGGNLITHYYYNSDFGTLGAIGTRGGVSLSAQTAPAMTVSPGSTVGLISMERTTATPTTVASIVNSNGTTVNNMSYFEAASGGATSILVGEWVEQSSSTGSTTVTYSGGSTNGLAFHFLETAYSAPAQDPTLFTLTKQITAGTDDGCWSTASPTPYFDFAATTMRVGDGTTTDYNRSIWMRFPGLTIPQGATIISATVGFTTAGGSSSTMPFTTIKAEAVDNATAITSRTDLLSRTKATTTSSWHPVQWPVSGGSMSTSNFAPVLQQLVSRPGWRSGNAAQFFIEETTDDGWTGTVTSITMNTADNATPNTGPTLYVTYRVGAPAFAPQPNVKLLVGGVETAVSAHYWTGTNELPVATTSTRHRINTVANTMTDPSAQPFYVAHRGGSASWPESSQYAYRQAAAWPMRALEISCFMTSDGVWVSSHDQSTLRITGVDIDIPTNTWASMSSLTVAPPSGNSNQPRQPLSKVVDILNDFAKDHVIFIEDKSYKNQAALINLIKTYPDYQQHFIWKHSGPSTSTGPDLAKAAGLKTWAYYFTGADMVGLFGTGATNAARYEYLGIDSACTDAEMNQLVALNRPFTSHILTTTAQRDRMRSFGAVGHMCANIGIVVPPQ